VDTSVAVEKDLENAQGLEASVAFHVAVEKDLAKGLGQGLGASVAFHVALEAANVADRAEDGEPTVEVTAEVNAVVVVVVEVELGEQWVPLAKIHLYSCSRLQPSAGDSVCLALCLLNRRKQAQDCEINKPSSLRRALTS